ncbi:uncharacterized protein LOC128671419 [Plodia interpunctella]|uniref:uncharacterized protein LOC128671419 n=1 Tax=Plodia interpunctella TaxID=58824 RepID=UPI0023681C2A|nr:uncharacterized protein LOC128671419 [Plodia interpunctella]
MLHGVENLLRLYDKSYIIGRGSFYPPFAEKTRQYILFGCNVTDIVMILDWMRHHQFDNTGKHIVVCESQDEQQCDETDAVQILWDHKITDVVFLKNDYKDEVLGYSYFPLVDGCNSVKPIKLNNLDSIYAEIFPMKLRNLQKCPLTVSIYQQVPYMTVVDGITIGADGDLLRIIIDALNATLRIMNPHKGSGWGYLDEDGQWMGSLGDVYNDLANFSMTSGALTLSRFSYFQLSIDYYSAKLIWITHPAPLQPSSLKLLYPIQAWTQTAMIMSFLFVGVVAMFVRSRFWAKICRKTRLKPPRVSIVFYSWLICMGLPLIRLPTHQGILTIVILWIWYCFMIRTIYQVCLIPVLRSNYYYADLDTIQDAFYANYPFGGGISLRDYYIDDPLLFDNWQVIETANIIPSLFDVANGKKFVLAMSGENAITLIRTKNLQVHILKEKLISTPTVIFFKKFSPLVLPINNVLRPLIESGLVDKLYKDYMKKLQPQEMGTTGPINSEHYKGCYLILMAGWVTSFACFIFEILYAKYYEFCNSLLPFKLIRFSLPAIIAYNMTLYCHVIRFLLLEIILSNMAECEYTNLILKQHENASAAMVNLGKLAAKIAYYNFEWRFYTLVLLDSMRVAASVESFLLSYNKPIVLKYGEFEPRHRVKVIQFVIFGYDSKELSLKLAWLARSHYDISARFVIVCANDDYKRCNQNEAFQTISKTFMVNSIYLQSTEGKDEPTAFTYFPMKPNKCTNNSPEEIKIDPRCSNHSCRNVFPEKLNNFFGCSLYISTIHQPPYMYLNNDYEEPHGADGDIIKLVAIILNATLTMKLPIEKSEWGHSVDNNWTGSLGDVFNKRVHASMASIPITPGKNGNFQISFPYYSMEMVWTTRLPDLKPSWEKLLRPLETMTRVALSIMFIIIVIINAFLKTKMWERIRTPLNISRTKSNLLFKSYIIFLGMSVSRMPIKPALRIFVFSWLWFSFIMRCAYQATLFNSLRTTYYDETFDDIRDAIQAGYTYGGTISLRDYYLEEQDIFENWKTFNFDNINDVLVQITKDNIDVAVAVNKASILHHLTQSNGSKHLQIIRNQIVTSPTVLYFKKFSPYVPAIDRILIVLVEAGFTDMLYARYLDQDIYLFEHPPGYGTTPLGFDHFATCFILLVIGWFVSAIYFAVEMFCKPSRG